MSYNVKIADNFKKEAKKLLKKYVSLKTELAELFLELEINPSKGTPLGNNIYKIRLAITSKNKGKSGGARLISFVKVVDGECICYPYMTKGKEAAYPSEK